jgi:ADP-ribose pyrophosphatase YjhB (NUDIX family)
MQPKVRVAGILIEGNRMLIVEQDVTDTRHWSLPGGALEFGETIEECLVREMKEETGLDVSVTNLLYICDRIIDKGHIVHITLLVDKIGGDLGTGDGVEFDTGKIKSVKMVPVDELQDYGFSATFCGLVKSDFPDRGTYKGNVINIGL